MDTIIQVLQAAGSQSFELVKQAEAQIKDWEKQNGFHTKLLEVFVQRNLDVNIRWVAIICLKNGINRYWRRVNRHCMSEDEKNIIKENVTIFDEPIPELNTQLSLVIARIARSDIKRWPQCLDRTLELFRADTKPLLLYEEELHKNRTLVETAGKNPNIRSATSSPPRPLDTAGAVNSCRSHTISSDYSDNGSMALRSWSHWFVSSCSSKPEAIVIENKQAMAAAYDRLEGQRERRGVVISLTTTELHHTVIEPGDIEKKWCKHSFGPIFKHKLLEK